MAFVYPKVQWQLSSSNWPPILISAATRYNHFKDPSWLFCFIKGLKSVYIDRFVHCPLIYPPLSCGKSIWNGIASFIKVQSVKTISVTIDMVDLNIFVVRLSYSRDQHASWLIQWFLDRICAALRFILYFTLYRLYFTSDGLFIEPFVKIILLIHNQ